MHWYVPEMMCFLDWGTVPAWLTLGSVVAALSTLIIGRMDAARAPAAQVYAVVVDHVIGRPDEGSFTDVEVRNDGDYPIFEPSVQLWDWGRPRRLTWRLRRIQHWFTSPRKGWVNGRFVPAGSRTSVHRLPGLESDRTGKGSAIPPIVLMFRDGNGKLWARWPDGQLKRVSLSRWLG
jgi:hypothetical protein